MSRPVVFVIGAPRSGTTLAQRLLGSHPAIVTSQETDLFCSYVATWRNLWERQLPSDEELWARQRRKGLPAVLTEDRFDALVNEFVERVYAATAELDPNATTIVDKTPANALHGELILRYLPSARFVHVIRDGRDVACSMLRAKEGWGREWAEGNIQLAARNWRRHVEAGRSIVSLTDAYREVRYEELVSAEALPTLAGLFSFVGVDASEEACTAAWTAAGADSFSGIAWGGEVMRRIGRPQEEPEGFVGEGRAGAWRKELGAYGRVQFERHAGALLRELGYASGDWLELKPTVRRVLAARLAVARVGGGAKMRIRGALHA